MSDTLNKYIVLFEYDRPLDMDNLLSYEAGVWFWVMAPGDVKVTDDNGNTGYYDDTNEIIYNIKSLRVDDENYSMTESYADMFATNKSFYYDRDGTGAGSYLIGGEELYYDFLDTVSESALIGDEELYYDFSNSADLGEDSSAGGNDGTATNVTQTTGPFDKAASFNGTTSTMATASDGIFGAGKIVTLAGWIKPTDSTDFAFSYPDAGNGNRFYILPSGAGVNVVINQGQTKILINDKKLYLIILL